MNVLFLPENVASGPALTATELNKIEGVSAISLTQTLSIYNSVNEHVRYLPSVVTKRKPVKWLLHKISNSSKVKELINWADVLHYTWGPYFKDGRDLAWAKKAGKPIFVEWAGSDIRNPDLLSSINPYYKKAFEGGYEYKNIESAYNSRQNQEMFAQYNAVPFQSPEMNLYINKQLFPKTLSLLQRLTLKDFDFSYPPIQKKKPLLVHSPSAKIAKGSDIIIPMIEELKQHYYFDFRLIHNVPRAEALAIIRESDIFLDQIIIGGYGLAATEAMAMGKPVMCYIMPEVFSEGLSKDCPIYNTNPDNLRENLATLISDAQLRHELGIKSRLFAEKHHDLEMIAPYLVETYSTALRSK